MDTLAHAVGRNDSRGTQTRYRRMIMIYVSLLDNREYHEVENRQGGSFFRSYIYMCA